MGIFLKLAQNIVKEQKLSELQQFYKDVQASLLTLERTAAGSSAGSEATTAPKKIENYKSCLLLLEFKIASLGEASRWSATDSARTPRADSSANSTRAADLPVQPAEHQADDTELKKNVREYQQQVRSLDANLKATSKRFQHERERDQRSHLQLLRYIHDVTKINSAEEL